MKVHFYFHSPKIPDRYQECIDSWGPFHAIKIWHAEDLDIDPGLSPNLQSDVARFKILYAEGGLWADTDMVCLKSMDDLIQDHRSFAFETGFPIKVANCCFYSVKGNPLMLELLDATYEVIKSRKCLSEECMRHSEIFLAGGTKIYPKEFMPILMKKGLTCGTDGAYAIHKHFCGWL